MLSITKFLKKNKTLSVLTCTLQSRIKWFSELNDHLKVQAKKRSLQTISSTCSAPTLKTFIVS